MKIMSDGIQQGAGSRLQSVLGFMTGNRVSGVLTGLSVTAIIQSSSATTVMVVAFVNAGIMTLNQAIGVIMGANIGTTVTAWVVSLIGFSLNLSNIALPAVGIGFVFAAIKWKHREIGNIIMGFGLLFLGIDFLADSVPKLNPENIAFIERISEENTESIMIGLIIGFAITMLLHSSSAASVIFLTMAHSGIIELRFGAAMIMGANMGTTIDAVLVSIGRKTTAKRAALVHVLFNCIGTIWAFFLISPMLSLIGIIIPGKMSDSITERMALFHTLFNLFNTIIFLPFVNQFAKLVSFIIKDNEAGEKIPETYRLSYVSRPERDPPELSILYAEKEIRDMAALALSMYGKLRSSLQGLNEEQVATLIDELGKKEQYADQMREEITRFLLECIRRPLNIHSEHNISLLIRIIADLEDLTDDCYAIGILLQRSVLKNQIFKPDQMETLKPYMGMVEEFLAFVGKHLGGKLNYEQNQYAKKIENDIDNSRDILRKLGRKRIEAGENVKTELLFIDLVRRIERLGDYCYSISAMLSVME
jgi:phosphate:Na+ symporter